LIIILIKIGQELKASKSTTKESSNNITKQKKGKRINIFAKKKDN